MAEYSQVKFRPGSGSSLESELVARADEPTDSAFSRIARRDLERYYALLARSLPTFSEQEALLLVNALNGARVEPERAHRLYIDVQELLEESEDARKMVAPEFLVRLRGLSRFECMAVVDAVERFWHGANHKNAEEVARRLREVGLIKGE